MVLQFIVDIRRLKTLFKKRIKKQNFDIFNDEEIKRWFSVPFISKVTEKFKNIANIIKTKLAFFSIQKLNGIIRA